MKKQNYKGHIIALSYVYILKIEKKFQKNFYILK